MSLETTGNVRPVSPASSGRSSPVPRASRRAVEDGVFKADKSLRRYAAVIERTLSTWETAPQDWADYIAFLGRLLKAIQSHPKDVPLLPHSGAIASKLSQCLNPALPSGVHSKALEVYSYIFSTFGDSHIASHLHEYLPGLSSVLAFASLSVRPGLYDLFEDHIVQLSASDLRPTLKSLTLSLLPALEDETSEDFERAFRIIESLQQSFVSHDEGPADAHEYGGYFWQCLFLAVITSPSRRQGAINYLTHKLPDFSKTGSQNAATDDNFPDGNPLGLSSDAEAAISPEPGLLIRAFACGLSDSQVLIQRAFLDLLVSNLPLHSPVLQDRIGDADLDRLVSAACNVLLRRDMGLNRRLWSWFLGPGNKDGGADSPQGERKSLPIDAGPSQLLYFTSYGRDALQRCLLAMMKVDASRPAERARPLRLCLSLMDRWEIGGTIVPDLFLPAMRSVYAYSLHSSAEAVTEVMRSASLFFDGVEARLIWSSLIRLIHDSINTDTGTEDLVLYTWIVERFNINDEEMLATHVPYHALYLLDWLCSKDAFANSIEKRKATLTLACLLLGKMHEGREVQPEDDIATSDAVESIEQLIGAFYDSEPDAAKTSSVPLNKYQTDQVLSGRSRTFLIRCMDSDCNELLSGAVSAFILAASKLHGQATSPNEELACAIERLLVSRPRSDRLSFRTLSSIVSLYAVLGSSGSKSAQYWTSFVGRFEYSLAGQIWEYLSPSQPKYHVESVKLLWQMGALSGSQDLVAASLNSFIRRSQCNSASAAEAARRYSVLWNHTIAIKPAASRSDSRRGSRRASTMTTTLQPGTGGQRKEAITESLMLVLDALNDTSEPAFNVVRSWLHATVALDELFSILLQQIVSAYESTMQLPRQNHEAEDRRHEQHGRTLDYLLHTMHNILKNANDLMWQTLSETTVITKETNGTLEATTFLAHICTTTLQSNKKTSVNMRMRVISVLSILLTSPVSEALRPLELDNALIQCLVDVVANEPGEPADTQVSILQLTRDALRVRLRPSLKPPRVPVTRRDSFSTRKPSTVSVRKSISEKSPVTTTFPPAQLIRCIQIGFSTDSTRLQLDQWLDFLADILPAYADAIFSNLLPLVDTFCKQLGRVFGELVATAQGDAADVRPAPEATIMYLLDGLDMILARAHECLSDEHMHEAAVSQAEPLASTRSFASGVFKAQGPPSKTSKANSRLTVVLTFQDAVRMCLKMWMWASRSAEDEASDLTSAATTAYNSLKLRNRTRNMLEQIFSVEPLETLEVVIYHWSHAATEAEGRVAMSLLQVMTSARPKTNLPVILDVLCSRTNSHALPISRQSSMTTDLDALEVVSFLTAYLDSVEDDAMDEIWPDCTAFMRDVLANPLPWRQILPPLLLVALLLAEKLSNTNYGEQRRMKRELSDIFQRLLTASFTTMPSGYNTESTTKRQDLAQVNGIANKPSTSFATVLKRIVSNIETIVDTPERVGSVINSVAANVTGPLLHAKGFPATVNADVLATLLQMAQKAPAAKAWKKDVADAFNDPRLLASPIDLVENGWFPLFQHWSMGDKERMTELLSRLTPPTSAGIVFGVGANAARLDADRRTQLNLRRTCILLLCAPENTHVMHLRAIEEKLVELFASTQSSSPSVAIKAELYMLCRAVVLSLSAVQLAPMWPVINESLQSALMSLLPDSSTASAFTNFAVLQACKLLDLLVALSPDDFQLHEWLYITDTIDAVYHPIEWTPVALADQAAEALSAGGADGNVPLVPATPLATSISGRRRPFLSDHLGIDEKDVKALSREDFARAVLQPFLSQLSMHAYEGMYSMETPDTTICRRSLLQDLLDLGTIVE